MTTLLQYDVTLPDECNALMKLNGGGLYLADAPRSNDSGVTHIRRKVSVLEALQWFCRMEKTECGSSGSLAPVLEMYMDEIVRKV